MSKCKKDNDLKDKLENLKKEKKEEKNNKEIEKLQKTISKLETEKKEIQDTCTRAQHDYINLRSDMNVIQRRTEEKEKTMKLDILIETTKKFLPFVEELRKSIENIADENKKTPLAKWVELTYNKFIKTLETMNIFPIESIWKKPNTLLHEPVSMQTTDNKKLKWKIIQEFERWFLYKKWDKQIIITTSKVIIGQ